jgi:hypothetical protein
VKIGSRRLTLLFAIGLILMALALFLASAMTPPAVTVEWSTASELNTAGFNILRGDTANGPFTRLNAEVIPASPDPLVGGTYVFTDTRVAPGQTYYYQLEEVEFSGSTSPQGTVTVTAPYGVEPILVVPGIALAVVVIAALLWSERPRRGFSSVATNTTSITVGPLCVIVDTPDPGVHAVLRSAYRAFAADAAPAPRTLTAHIAYTPGPAPADWPFTFQDGVLRFTAPHCAGSIDVRNTDAQIQITAPQPFEPIDYCVRTALALLAFDAGGLLFHAAGLARRDQGYGFFGYSGSGKTTVARVSSDAVILNDDLVVLLPQADRWRLYATPFFNPTQMTPPGPQSVPLAALYRLVQDRRVFMEPIDPAAAIAEVIASSPVVSADPDRALTLLARAEQLATAVPVQRLHFLPDSSFWAVVQP